MLKKNYLKSVMLVSMVAITLDTSFVFAQSKPSIKSLTSKKTSEETKDELPESSGATIPKALKVHSLGIGLGQTFVKGDFNRYGDDEITWDLLYNYSASYSFDFMANIHYSKHKFKETYSSLSGVALGIKGKFYQFDAFSPYAVGGLGFYSPRVKRMINGELLESKSKIVFGTHLGIGAELKLNRHFSTGLLGHYHNPFDVKQEVGPEVEGSYFKLLITGMYSF